MACYNYALKNAPGYTSGGWFSWTNCDGTQESQWIENDTIHVCAQQGTITDTATDSIYSGGTVVCVVNTASITVPNQVVLTLDDVGTGCHEFQIFSNFSSSANLIDTVDSSSLSLGYVLGGNDIFETYTICCLDDSGVKQNCSVLSTCSPADTGSSDLTNLTPIECDGTKYYSGNQVFPAIYEIELGTDTGTVSGSHNAYGIPDKFVVEWSGSIVYNSGYVGSTSHQSSLNTNLISRGELQENITNLTPTYGGQAGYGTFSFEKNTPLPNKAIVKVYGPLGGTAWEVTIDCPTGSAGIPPTPQDPPSNGCSEVTGTTVLEKTTTPVASVNDVSFTISEGSFADVILTGSFHQGYFIETASMELLDSNDNLIQNFNFYQSFAQYMSDTVYNYEPSSFRITGSSGGTTYKLSVGSNAYMSRDYGEGVISLTVGNCGQKENHITTYPNWISSVSSNNINVYWNGVGDEYDELSLSTINSVSEQDARDLISFFTGRSASSVSQNTLYNFKSNIIDNGGFNVFEEDISDDLGNINITSASSVRWYITSNLSPTANVYTVELRNVSSTGDLTAGTGPTDDHKFRIK